MNLFLIFLKLPRADDDDDDVIEGDGNYEKKN